MSNRDDTAHGHTGEEASRIHTAFGYAPTAQAIDGIVSRSPAIRHAIEQLERVRIAWKSCGTRGCRAGCRTPDQLPTSAASSGKTLRVSGPHLYRAVLYPGQDRARGGAASRASAVEWLSATRPSKEQVGATDLMPVVLRAPSGWRDEVTHERSSRRRRAERLRAAVRSHESGRVSARAEKDQ
jgi:hypothetical protein